jgi:hypothetical protein
MPVMFFGIFLFKNCKFLNIFVLIFKDVEDTYKFPTQIYKNNLTYLKYFTK